MSAALPAGLTDWLAASAEGIDLGEVPADAILPHLAEAGLPRLGVPADLGGAGGDAIDAVDAVAAVARESLAAAFMLWGHRCYAEFLVQTTNEALRERQLPDILSGKVAGAAGLSNAMKFLAGLEPLQVTAREEGDGLRIDGKLPWVTNLRPNGFHVATAADRAEGGPTIIVALSHDDPGLTRSGDLALLRMRSSDTAAVRLEGVRVPRDRVLSDNAQAWLPGVRPLFMALQCGMAIGLAARALDEADACTGPGRAILSGELCGFRDRLREIHAAIAAGLRSGAFIARPEPLFELRIALTEIVTNAVMLELQAGGGRSYLREPGRGFARRWREAAFIPIITPSVVQLRSVLAAAKQTA